MASIAIVGGAGFIGERLAAALRSAGHGVTVVDVVAPAGDEAAYRQADVGDRDTLCAALDGAEVVYNLAAVHRDDVKPITRYDEVNVGGATNVCGVCRELGIERLIFTSSAAVYGTAAPDSAEERAPAPFNAYGRTKLLAEQIHRAWQAEAPGRRSLVIVRPTVVFGEANRGNVYQLLRQIASRRFLMVGKEGVYKIKCSQFCGRKDEPANQTQADGTVIRSSTVLDGRASCWKRTALVHDSIRTPPMSS